MSGMTQQKNWDDKKGEVFASRLQAASISGLSLPPPRPRYVVQYKNSLIGKHFKMLQQIGVFQLHDLCTPLILDLWKATGELGAYLWFPEIKDMRVYLADLQVLVDNLLDIWGLIDPNRILVKGKLHVLPHTLDDTRRILSNHLSPSHDIAATLADMERFKHMVSGGWWQDSTGGEYIRAGSSVRSFLTSNRELQRRLGWSEKTTLASGIVKLEAVKNRVSSKWNLPLQEPEPVGATWAHCKYVSAQTGDLCKPGFWVFIQTSDVHYSFSLATPFPARITKILAREGSNSNNATVIVEPFVVLDVKDARLNMPLLVPSPDATLMAINPMDIMLSFNVQHDCVHSKCKPDMVRVRQERTLTDRTELQITHTEEQRFILNMHALHNGHLIGDILPRSLTAPVPYLQDRVVTVGLRNNFAKRVLLNGRKLEPKPRLHGPRINRENLVWPRHSLRDSRPSERAWKMREWTKIEVDQQARIPPGYRGGSSDEALLAGVHRIYQINDLTVWTADVRGTSIQIGGVDELNVRKIAGEKRELHSHAAPRKCGVNHIFLRSLRQRGQRELLVRKP
ncbi:hypothetical protein B0H14DRAFT_2621088 [Mycena olivaceomarginata]|nr:hypothetical protein B0H14DRAFT_2621088 [Mycena olivaceomarginata]